MVTGVFQEGITGAPLTALAFSQNIPGGEYIVTIALIVFGFTTLLGWSYYGERCYEYVFGTKSIFLYRIVWVLAIFWFANQKIELVWNLAETSVLFMVIPNVIGLLILSPMVAKLSGNYWKRHKAQKKIKQIQVPV